MSRMMGHLQILLSLWMILLDSSSAGGDVLPNVPLPQQKEKKRPSLLNSLRRRTNNHDHNTLSSHQQGESLDFLKLGDEASSGQEQDTAAQWDEFQESVGVVAFQEVDHDTASKQQRSLQVPPIVDSCNITLFTSKVVIEVNADFLNATADEVGQFENSFQESFNRANGNTSDRCDPLGREIVNVTTNLDFSFSRGVANVPIIPVRNRQRFLQTTPSNATISVPTRQFASVVMFVTARCTRCPTSQALFDDVTVRRGRRLQLPPPPETFSCTTCQQNTSEIRGASRADVLANLVNITQQVEVQELAEVDEFNCPGSADIFLVDVELEMLLEFQLSTSELGIEELEELFAEEYNELAEDFCDPLFRSVVQAKINRKKLPDNSIGQMVTVPFTVQVECLGQDCETVGKLFGDEGDGGGRLLRAKRTLQGQQQQYQQQQPLLPRTPHRRYQKILQDLKNRPNTRVLDDGEEGEDDDEDEGGCFCDINPRANRAATQGEFLEYFQEYIDELNMLLFEEEDEDEDDGDDEEDFFEDGEDEDDGDDEEEEIIDEEENPEEEEFPEEEEEIIDEEEEILDEEEFPEEEEEIVVEEEEILEEEEFPEEEEEIVVEEEEILEEEEFPEEEEEIVVEEEEVILEEEEIVEEEEILEEEEFLEEEEEFPEEP